VQTPQGYVEIPEPLVCVCREWQNSVYATVFRFHFILMNASTPHGT